jgi:tryptophan synthase alpha chain
VKSLRKFTALPIAVGFGVSNAEHVKAIGEFADAAVVGSVIVRLIE